MSELSTNPKNMVTRIQRRNINIILEAALEVFSTKGYNGSTLDQISMTSGLSKANILYYFANKEDILNKLLNNLLDNWLEPLRALNSTGNPIEEITSYVQRKFEMAQTYPRESRLFAMEILHGAKHLETFIAGDLKKLVYNKAKVIEQWIEKGLISEVDPIQLIFSIWAVTQHYADFEAQINLICEPNEEKSLKAASQHLNTMFTKMLIP